MILLSIIWSGAKALKVGVFISQAWEVIMASHGHTKECICYPLRRTFSLCFPPALVRRTASIEAPLPLVFSPRCQGRLTSLIHVLSKSKLDIMLTSALRALCHCQMSEGREVLILRRIQRVELL